jgi:tetratricopeptide (TPR) repeat protein
LQRAYHFLRYSRSDLQFFILVCQKFQREFSFVTNLLYDIKNTNYIFQWHHDPNVNSVRSFKKRYQVIKARCDWLYYKKQYDEALFAYSNLLLISAKNVVQMLKYEFPINLKQLPTRNEIIDGLKLYIKKRLAGEDLKAESEPVEEETKQQKTIEDPHKKKGKQDKSGVQFHVMARREVEESIARCLMQLGAIDVAADYFEALVSLFKVAREHC